MPGGRRLCPFRGRAERAGRVERGADESPGESWAAPRPVGPGGRARGAALRRPSGSAGLRAAARNRRRAGVRAGSAATPPKAGCVFRERGSPGPQPEPSSPEESRPWAVPGAEPAVRPLNTCGSRET